MPTATTPIRPTSAPAILDRAFSDLLGKVRQLDEQQPKTPVREATINIVFSGGGQALPASGLPGVVEIPFSSRIVSARLFAGDEQLQAVAVEASVGLWVGSFESWPIGAPLYSGNHPSLVLTSVAEVDTSAWITNLVTGDLLYYVLMSFVGDATWMAIHLRIRGTGGEEGSADVVDWTGDQLVDGSGNTVTYRV